MDLSALRARLADLLSTQRGRWLVGGAAAVLVVAVIGISLVVTGGDGARDGDGGPPTTTGRADGPEPTEDDPGYLASARAIQAAVDRAEPGDELVIASGTYELSLDIHGVSGTAERPIRLRAEPGGEVTLRADDAPYALYVHGAAHWRIGAPDGRLTFDGDEQALATVGLGLYSGSIAESSNHDPGPADDIVLENVDIVRSGQGLLRIAHGSRGIEVVDSRLSGSGRRRAEFGEGVYIGSSTGEDLVEGVRLTDVTISDVRAEAVDVKAGADDIVLRRVEIRDVVLSSDDTNNKCAIAHRSQGRLTVIDSSIRNVDSFEGVKVSRNEPCGIYVDGPITIERTRIEDTGREAVWVNNGVAGVHVEIVESEFTGNGGEPSGISHSGKEAEWTIRGNELDGLSPSIAGPNVEPATDPAASDDSPAPATP